MPDNWRESLKCIPSVSNSPKPEMPEDYNMGGYIGVIFIDYNESHGMEIKRYYGNVYCKYITIEDMQRRMSKIPEWKFLGKADAIFVDTRYDNGKSGEDKKYAIDMLDEYMKISEEHKEQIKDKYQILISQDDFEDEFSNPEYRFTDILQSDRRIYTRARQLSHMEYGMGLGTKNDRIREFIEERAKQRKIYLYRRGPMNLAEWNSYINYYFQELQKLKPRIETCRDLIDSDKIDEIISVIDGIQKPSCFSTIQQARNFTETKLYEIYNKLGTKLKETRKTKKFSLENARYEEYMFIGHEVTHMAGHISGKLFREREFDTGEQGYFEGK